MRPLFTVNGGEFLVASELERRGAKVWIPSKDTGIDLLVTDQKVHRLLKVQVKQSRDYSVSAPAGIVAEGWWTFDLDKVKTSLCDLWVFVLPAFHLKKGVDFAKTHYVLVPPRKLADRLTRLGRTGRMHTYLGVTEAGKCWEMRDVPKRDMILMAGGAYTNRDRDFTEFLDDWKAIRRCLGKTGRV